MAAVVSFNSDAQGAGAKVTMKWIVYNALFTVAYFAMLPSFLLRMKRRGGYKADRKSVV